MVSRPAEPQVHTAIVRTDGSASLGGGHLLRTQALAASLHARGWRCVFAVRPETLDVFPDLARQHDCLLLDCDSEDEPARLRACRHGTDGLVIVDHPERGLDFEAACRPWARHIVSIDGTLRPHDCDLLVDPIPDRQRTQHGDLVSPHCILLCGPQYAPLRSSFARFREESLVRRAQRHRVTQIVVAAGATDPANQTVRLLGALDDSRLPSDVRVVVAAGSRRRDAIEESASRSRLCVEIYEWIQDPARLFAESDLAMGCSGSTCWELCALGVPSIVVAVAANQEPVADSLRRHGAAIVLGRHDDVQHSQIVAAIDRLTNDTLLYQDMSQAAARLCDGRGADRVARIVHGRLGAG